ncbi:MAG: FKBP-type peptidyl-prolyl cis-trans isomerase [Flavobacteriales bacterium]
MKLFLCAMAAGSLIALSSCENKGGGAVSDVELVTMADSVSYSLGMTFGDQLNGLSEKIDISDLDYEMFMRGLKDSRDSSAALELEEVQMYLDTEFKKRRDSKMESLKGPADAYMAANKSLEGVVTTGSGLQYKVMQEGQGPKPMFGDTVLVHYTGKFINGEIFDTSEGMPAPIEFVIEPGMVEGWNEGLQLMAVGGKYVLYVPWNLGFGKEGSRGIEPYSNLVFDIELLGVKKPK